jgi:uncharacterized protein YecT (DUF1311 family)
MPTGDPISLPEPPPPRSDQREAAIGAALRRFDGIEDPAPTRQQRPSAGGGWWARSRQPQFAMAMSLVLIAVIGLPAMWIAIRNGALNPPSEPERPEVSRSVAKRVETPRPSPPVKVAPPTTPQTVSATPKAGPPAQEAKQPPNARDAPAETQAAPPAPLAAAPPPPPPPPPAPGPAAPAQKAEGATAGNIVVTGSRVARPNRSVQADAFNSLPARESADSLLSSEFRRCFGKDAPLNAESYGCFDREYHRLDRVLAAEYRAALARQPDAAARQRLQRNQRAWLGKRFRHCKDDVGDFRGSTATVINENCEIDALAARIAWLRRR